MRVGILSMQRVNNHGSFWQAYLLKKMLTDNGCEVEFIDIIPGKKLRTNTDIQKKKLTERMRHAFRKKFFNYCFQPRKAAIFEKQQRAQLLCMQEPNYSSDYDSIIIGSDEVFNFAQSCPWGFSLQLHGKMGNANVNTYAASFGSATYDDIIKYGVYDEMVDAMSNLKHISVRDENSYGIISKILPNATVYRHLDPVLVGDLPVPKERENKRKYILIYAYDFRFNDKAYIKRIKEFARKKNCKIYSVGFFQEWVDKNINVNSFELLHYFVDAEYVVTDTFHGTIFSVRCHKKFAVVIRKGSTGNRQKLSSLLNTLKLENRLLSEAETFEKVLTADIDYYAVDSVLSYERKRTEEYLEQCIGLK